MVKRLIVVDGLDGCGKDSHASKIRAALERRGDRVTVVSQRSTRLLGRVSKRALQGTDNLSRFVASVFFTADILVSAGQYNRRREGTTIFVRYLLGSAYLPKRVAPMGYRFFRRLLPFPDLAIFVDIEPEVAIRRIEKRDHAREMFETLEHLRSVRETARTLVGGEWVVVDNSEDGERPFVRVAEILVQRKVL